MLRGGAFAVDHQPGKRKPTKEQFTRDIFRDMVDFMRNPAQLEGSGVKRVEATCKKCDWPLSVDQVVAMTCPSCGKLRHSDVGFRAET
jgi:hypothetical protein